MADDRKRITFEEAKALYPEEWVVFTEQRMEMTNTTFIDGVVYFHGKDHEEALEKMAEIEGDAGIDFTGQRSYEKTPQWDDAKDQSTDKAA